MKYIISFMVQNNIIATNSMAPIFDNYDWWVNLAGKALQEADEFEFRLWEDDVEGIKSGERWGQRVPNHETLEIVFAGKVGHEIKEEILYNYLTPEGYIKWFTLILKKDSKPVFISSHYGDETHIFVNSREEADAVREWAKKYPIIWRVDVFTCE